MRTTKIIIYPASIITLFLFLLAKCGEPENRPPEIDSINLDTTEIEPGDTIQITVVATDPDSDTLGYEYAVTRGQILNTNLPVTTWHTPFTAGFDTISVTINDGEFFVEKRKAVEVGSKN